MSSPVRANPVSRLSKGAGLVILDRDGVLNELVLRRDGSMESPLDPADVHIRAGVTRDLRFLRESGFLLACVTNQPAAAKGECNERQLEAVHRAVLDHLVAAGISLDAQRVCPHHPNAVERSFLKESCGCRKPAPGMLLAVAEELDVGLSRCWMVGDTDDDVKAGQAAGVATILVRTPGSSAKRGRSDPDWVVPDLGVATKIIVRHSS
jgi:D-glycero-D-manno-heptose 1,7-bisphosphate phosphatase